MKKKKKIFTDSTGGYKLKWPKIKNLSKFHSVA